MFYGLYKFSSFKDTVKSHFTKIFNPAHKKYIVEHTKYCHAFMWFWYSQIWYPFSCNLRVPPFIPIMIPGGYYKTTCENYGTKSSPIIFFGFFKAILNYTIRCSINCSNCYHFRPIRMCQKAVIIFSRNFQYEF